MTWLAAEFTRTAAKTGTWAVAPTVKPRKTIAHIGYYLHIDAVLSAVTIIC